MIHLAEAGECIIGHDSSFVKADAKSCGTGAVNKRGLPVTGWVNSS